MNQAGLRRRGVNWDVTLVRYRGVIVEAASEEEALRKAEAELEPGEIARFAEETEQ